MRRYRFIQLDVFTHTPFGGNQLAVFPEAAGLSDAAMQAIAREMNFSETTFVLPASDPKALRRVRIFTPSTELPMAGHPTVGTTFALAREGVIRAADPSPIYLQLGIGTLPIDLLFAGDTLSFVWMHQPAPVFQPWQGDRAQLAAALGLTVDDLDETLPIEHGSAGVAFVYIPLRSLAALGRARPGADLAAALAAPSSNIGAHLFTLDIPPGALPGGADARARMFAPGMGVTEDPATGSAAGPFGVYLVRHGRATLDPTGEARIRLEQGVEMERPSDLTIAVQMDGETVRDVRVGGEAVVVAEGELFVP
jgi:trans-2,3-dihydro-3-hydroxyanthranilate isomerase